MRLDREGRFNEGFQEREPVSSFSRHDVQKPFLKTKNACSLCENAATQLFSEQGLFFFCLSSCFVVQVGFFLMLQIWPVF